MKTKHQTSRDYLQFQMQRCENSGRQRIVHLIAYREIWWCVLILRVRGCPRLESQELGTETVKTMETELNLARTDDREERYHFSFTGMPSSPPFLVKENLQPKLCHDRSRKDNWEKAAGGVE